jgi:Ca2+-binding RTX toxin-like protein
MRTPATTLSLFLLLAVAASGARSAPAAFSGAIVFERDVGSSSDIYVSTAPKTATALVATAAQEFDPALSSDGRVAFARAKGEHSEIYVYASGAITRTTNDGAVDQQTAWSRDGDRIAYSSDKGKGADIREVKVGQPASAHAIAPAPGDDFTPSYARDGRIAFASNRSGNFELYVVTPAGKLTRLTRDPDVELSPAWSPDDKRIVFTRVDTSGNAEIWLLTVATRALTRLTNNPADDSEPHFAPDGSQIAFVSDRKGTPAVWTMPAKRGATATLFSSAKVSVDLSPHWGPKPPAGKAAGSRTILRTAGSITCPISGPYAGTLGADSIDGSDTADDTICGRAGNDTIRGLGGHDQLSGGDGNDTVMGGNDSDPIVSGGPGVDSVQGGYGSDPYLSAGSGADNVYGGYGDDKLFARDSTKDYLSGGYGFDRAQYDPVDTKASIEATIP